MEAKSSFRFWRAKTGGEKVINQGKHDEFMSKMDATMSKSEERDKEYQQKFGHIDANMRNLEFQMGQLAQSIHTRPQGSLPSDTILNPKGNQQCKAIILRSGKTVGLDDHVSKNERAEDAEHPSKKDDCSGLNETEEAEKATNNREVKEEAEPKKEKKGPLGPFNFPEYVPPAPFPSRGHKKINKEQNFKGLLEMFRKVNVNILWRSLLPTSQNTSNSLKTLWPTKRKFKRKALSL